LDWIITFLLVCDRPALDSQAKKKADVVEHSRVFDHVGLLVNGLPGTPGSSFI